MILKRLLHKRRFLVNACLLCFLTLARGEQNNETITIHSVYYATSGINVDWTVNREELLKLPEWKIEHETAPLLDVNKAWRIACETIAKSLPDRNIVLESAELVNMRFSPSIRRAGGIVIGDRWFYVISAKPSTYRPGEPLSDPHLYSVVILANGEVIRPHVSKPDDMNIRKSP